MTQIFGSPISFNFGEKKGRRQDLFHKGGRVWILNSIIYGYPKKCPLKYFCQIQIYYITFRTIHCIKLPQPFDRNSKLQTRQKGGHLRTYGPHSIMDAFIPTYVRTTVIGHLPSAITGQSDIPDFCQCLADTPFEVKVISRFDTGFAFFAMNLISTKN